jgi:hypothetical protein
MYTLCDSRRSFTSFLGECPPAASPVLANMCKQLGILLGRPRPSFHAVLLAARCSPHHVEKGELAAVAAALNIRWMIRLPPCSSSANTAAAAL